MKLQSYYKLVLNPDSREFKSLNQISRFIKDFIFPHYYHNSLVEHYKKSGLVDEYVVRVTRDQFGWNVGFELL